MRGRDVDGTFLTGSTGAYPPDFCAVIANDIVDNFIARVTGRITVPTPTDGPDDEKEQTRHDQASNHPVSFCAELTTKGKMALRDMASSIKHLSTKGGCRQHNNPGADEGSSWCKDSRS